MGPVDKKKTPEEETIICRCSDITLADLRKMIHSGYTTIDEIKRLTRLGMGPCQGRTCVPLAMREIAAIVGKPIDGLCPGTYRPPTKSVKLGEIYEAATSERAGE